MRDQTINLDASIENSSGSTLISSWPPPGDLSAEWLAVLLEPGEY